LISQSRRLAFCVLFRAPPMDDSAVARLEKTAWTHETLATLQQLVASRGGAGRDRLEDALLRCDLLYLVGGTSGPRAFLLVARVRLPVGAERREARYVGLGAAQDPASAIEVMAQFTADARAEEEGRRTRLVLFTTESEPSTACSALTGWNRLEAAVDGPSSAELLPFADAARAWLAAGAARLLFHSAPLPTQRSVPARAA